MTADLLLVLVALVLVAANGFFVAVEFGVTRLRPTQAEDFVAQGRPGSRSVQHAVDHLDAYLAACQLGITVASLGLGAVGEPAFGHLFEAALGEGAAVFGIGLGTALGFLLVTLLHVVLGELSPKSLAIAKAGPILLLLAPPMRVFYLVTRPLVDLFNGLGNLVLKPFGIRPASESGHAPHSEEEILSLVRQSGDAGLVHADERTFAENVFQYGDRRARDVMVPRPEVAWVSATASVRDATRVAVDTGHSRLPLCEEGGLDAAVGLLHAKDLLRVLDGEPDSAATRLSRPLMRVPEAMRLDEVMERMREERHHLALVLDEHGTAVGALTLEDLLEEIVGDLEDEFEHEAAERVRRDGDELVVDGEASVHDVAPLATLADGRGAATVGGLVVERLGRVPDEGEEVDLDGLRVRVTRSDEAAVREVRVADAGHDRAPDAAETGEGGETARTGEGEETGR